MTTIPETTAESNNQSPWGYGLPKTPATPTTTPRPSLAPLPKSRDGLIAELQAAGCKIKGNACTCPNPDHDDANASCGVFKLEGTADVWNFKCHSCGVFGDVYDLQAMLTGRTLDDVLRDARKSEQFRPTKATQAKPMPVADTGPYMTALAQAAEAKITPEQRDNLAKSLGLSGEKLDRLGLGTHHLHTTGEDVFTWPMCDVDGKIIGVRTRQPDGQKLSIKTGHNGLFIPRDILSYGTLHVTEGPTDTAKILEFQ